VIIGALVSALLSDSADGANVGLVTCGRDRPRGCGPDVLERAHGSGESQDAPKLCDAPGKAAVHAYRPQWACLRRSPLPECLRPAVQVKGGGRSVYGDARFTVQGHEGRAGRGLPDIRNVMR